MNYTTVLLNASHQKNEFKCGKDLLDTYLHKQAKQDVLRKLAACFILDENNFVQGFYTLSSTSIERNILPSEIIKKLPPAYTNLPATLLGRLAIDNSCKGKGLGEKLLIDALKRCYDASLISVGSMAVIVDPIDEGAVKFYSKYGFLILPSSGKMFLPMQTISELFK